MMLDYGVVLTALHVAFSTASVVVDADLITFVSGQNMQIGEPSAVHRAPFLYSLVDRWEDKSAGRVPAADYSGFHRVAFKYLPGTETAAKSERQLIALLPALVEAVNSDKRLGGLLVRGYARIIRAEAGYDLVGSTVHRVLDLYSLVTVK